MNLTMNLVMNSSPPGEDSSPRGLINTMLREVELQEPTFKEMLLVYRQVWTLPGVKHKRFLNCLQ